MSIQVKPFIGPQPFDETNSSFFYGRDREVQEIIALILSSNVSLICSKSGIGKTSIFNAKIIPELQGRKYKSHVLPIIRFKSLQEIYVNDLDNSTKVSNIYIFNTLLGIIEKSVSKLETQNSIKENIKTLTLSEFLKDYLVPDRQKIVDRYYHSIKILIFDQFEEFFNIYITNRFKEQTNFFYQIRDAIKTDPNLRVVFVMREEFLASLDAFSYILPDAFRRKFRLEPLRKESAIHAIEKPLIRALYLDLKLKNVINEDDINKIANKVVENLLKIHVQRYDDKAMITDKTLTNNITKRAIAIFRTNDTKKKIKQTEIIEGEFVEPVQLQVVCLKLWEQKIITGKIKNEIDDIEFGDVDNALTDFYTDAVNITKKNTRTKENTIRKWCDEELITSAGTRSMVYRDVDSTAGLSNKAVDVLQNKYLIRAEERSGSTWFELTHDRMILPIKESNKLWHERRARAKRSFFLKVILPVISIVVIALALSALQFELQQQQEKKNAFIETGMSLINSGNYSAAIANLNRALAIDAHDKAALYNKGLALYNFGNQSANNYTKTAIQYYDKVLVIDPNDTMALYSKGKAYYSLGQYPEAIEYYDRILHIKPENLDSIYSKSQAYNSLGQYPDAINYYNKYIKELENKGFDFYRNHSLGIEMAYPANWTAGEPHVTAHFDEKNQAEYFSLFPPISKGDANADTSTNSLSLYIYGNANKTFNTNSFLEILNQFLSGDVQDKADINRKVSIQNWNGLDVSFENVFFTQLHIHGTGLSQFIALKTLYQNKVYNFLFFLDPKDNDATIPLLRYIVKSFRIQTIDGDLVTPFAKILDFP